MNPSDADPDVDLFQARPYAITGGRTKPRIDLDLISLVCVTGRGDPLRLHRSHAEALRLCTQPISVAEVAAHLALSVTVTKVILSDLIELGHIVDEPPPTQLLFSAEPELLEKVLVGLRGLTSGSSA